MYSNIPYMDGMRTVSRSYSYQNLLRFQNFRDSSMFLLTRIQCFFERHDANSDWTKSHLWNVYPKFMTSGYFFGKMWFPWNIFNVTWTQKHLLTSSSTDLRSQKSLIDTNCPQAYSWWQPEIRCENQLRFGSLSHYLQGFSFILGGNFSPDFSQTWTVHRYLVYGTWGYLRGYLFHQQFHQTIIYLYGRWLTVININILNFCDIW